MASIAAPQAADATTGVASVSGATSIDFAAQASRTQAIAQPLTATQAQQQLGSVKAKAELAQNVRASSLVVHHNVRPATSSVSRSTTRPARTTPVAQPKAAPAPRVSTPAVTGGIVSIAKQFIGTPYVYGGASPSGFDCSGFTSYVYKLAGKSIPRTATEQLNAAVRVSNPQPGDLVFYGSGTSAYHVGIYLGNGMMIDENHPGGDVGIRPLYSGVSGYGRV